MNKNKHKKTDTSESKIYHSKFENTLNTKNLREYQIRRDFNISNRDEENEDF